ncbi:MAG: epoxyqueuosine reductase [Anaerovorax sp.]
MKVNLKEEIRRNIINYVAQYETAYGLDGIWRKPLVGFADAKSPYIQNLKNLIGRDHEMPQDVMKDAKVVIAIFIPFTKKLGETNKLNEPLASPEWAEAYEQTNKMLGNLNEHFILELAKKGYGGAISKEALTYDQTMLTSNWSHRHFAYAAGLGTFGINNMLITKSGACGRYTSLVTNLDVPWDTPIGEEFCSYKKNGSCGICVKNCPGGALTVEGYDRNKCYQLLQENAHVYTQSGSSYVNDDGTANSVGSEVCGKCTVYTPCAFWNLK